MEYFTLLKTELLVALILFIILLLKLGSKGDGNQSNLLHFINGLLFLQVVVGFFGNAQGVLFDGMFRTNPLLSLEKNVLNIGVLLISLQSYNWLSKHKHMSEFYLLLLSSLLGMHLLISSDNLLMFYLSLELSTIPLAALTNFNLDQKKSSEAAFKLIVSSAFSSGLLLLGISFIYGTCGSIAFEDVAAQVQQQPLQVISFILIFAGFGFKISMVPFHLWTADVYEGAPIAVTAYLSVISKAAVSLVFISFLNRVFGSFEESWYLMLFFLSVLTMFVGNLFALRQNNIKRFLAFSSIAQIGFVLIAIAAGKEIGTAAVLFFMLVYVFSNLGAFGVVAAISDALGKETIEDYKGLYRTNPFLTWVMALSLFSLAGVPPTAGFFGKFFLLFAGASKINYIWITLAAMNIVISFYYYLRIVKVMFMDEPKTVNQKVQLPVSASIALSLSLAGILLWGLYGGLYDYLLELCKLYQS